MLLNMVIDCSNLFKVVCLSLNLVKIERHHFQSLNEILKINNLRQVHFASAESIISYGWGDAFNNVTVNLKTRQNLILRLLLKKVPMYPTNKLYKELNVPPVENLYLKSIAIFLKKNNSFQ